MFFNTNQSTTSFSVHRIQSQSGVRRIVITVPNQGVGSFNFDEDVFLSSFQLIEGSDPVGKRMLLLRVNDDEVMLCYGLSSKGVYEARMAFFAQLSANAPSAIAPSGITPSYPHFIAPTEAPTRKVKKRYVLGAIAIALAGTFLVWPVDERELIEIHDPVILEMIRNQSTKTSGNEVTQQGNITEQRLARESRNEKEKERRLKRSEKYDRMSVAALDSGVAKPVRTTGYLSPDGNSILRASINGNAIPLGDFTAPNVTPYLVFAGVEDIATAQMALGTNESGFLPVLIPVGIEKEAGERGDPMVRAALSFCSNDPATMWMKPSVSPEDIADVFKNNESECDWRTALYRFNDLAVIASEDGLATTPFVVAPNGAIFEHHLSKDATTEALVDWLKANPIK